jgi:hypothetical protein
MPPRAPTAQPTIPDTDNLLEKVISDIKLHGQGFKFKQYVNGLFLTCLVHFFRRDDTIVPFVQAARWFPVAVSPFVLIKRALYAGVRLEEQEAKLEVE